eukprot:12559967-Ditylum_brightwellii.AAC.1
MMVCPTFMTTHSISDGNEHYNSMKSDQRKLQPPYILAPCSDSSSYFCSTSHKETTHSMITSCKAILNHPPFTIV